MEHINMIQPPHSISQVIISLFVLLHTTNVSAGEIHHTIISILDFVRICNCYYVFMHKSSFQSANLFVYHFYVHVSNTIIILWKPHYQYMSRQTTKNPHCFATHFVLANSEVSEFMLVAFQRSKYHEWTSMSFIVFKADVDQMCFDVYDDRV